MSDNRYPPDALSDEDKRWLDSPDDTMVENIDALRQQVVGRRIVSAEKQSLSYQNPHYSWTEHGTGLLLTLDDGKQVFLAETSDCCAHTDVDNFLLHADRIDHVIIGVGSTEGYTKWHIYADLGDVLEIEVGWSPGNPYYYGYGFDIAVIEPEVQS